MICWALFRFIRSSIHALFSAGQNKSEAVHRLHRSQEKRKEARPNWIGSAIVSAQIVTVGRVT